MTHAASREPVEREQSVEDALAEAQAMLDQTALPANALTEADLEVHVARMTSMEQEMRRSCGAQSRLTGQLQARLTESHRVVETQRSELLQVKAEKEALEARLQALERRLEAA